MRAEADQESALAPSRASGDRRAEWRALLELGQLWAGRDYVGTTAYYRATLEGARALVDPTILEQSPNRLGNWLVNVDDPFLTAQSQQDALAHSERPVRDPAVSASFVVGAGPRSCG